MSFLPVIIDMVERGWSNFTARPEGPISLRFVLQPLVATVLAVRAGLADARNGRPAYLWSAFADPSYRQELLRSGWNDVWKVFTIAAVLDAIYQTVVHRAIYLFELLFTATLLAIVPYVLLRGPVNRVARAFVRRSPPSA